VITERRMRKSNLTVHREMFRDTCLKANKKDYFSNKIYKIEHDQKQLHRLTNNLMGNKRDVILPSHHDEKALADKFCEFFGSSSEYHSVFGRSIMFFDFNGACLSMMELSSELYSFTIFTTDPSRF
jgi:hypothetical protein